MKRQKTPGNVLMLTATGVRHGIGGQLDAEIPYHNASITHTHPGWIGGLIPDTKVGSVPSNPLEVNECMYRGEHTQHLRGQQGERRDPCLIVSTGCGTWLPRSTRRDTRMTSGQGSQSGA